MLCLQIDYPEIEEGTKPRHRFMSAYEQRKEAQDKKYQFLLFAADPYEVIAFKIPNSEVDRSDRLFSYWYDNHFSVECWAKLAQAMLQFLSTRFLTLFNQCWLRFAQTNWSVLALHVLRWAACVPADFASVSIWSLQLDSVVHSSMAIFSVCVSLALCEHWLLLSIRTGLNIQGSR